jgi:glucuronokinase
MRLVRNRAYARAGLVGNPSDAYFGKTISLIVRNLFAEVVLYEWDDLELLLTEKNRFHSVQDLVRDVKLHGYYGGIRLIKATIKKFVEFCQRQGFPLHARNFSIRYQSTIPRQVGLAGSSAIIVAALRCLMEFYDVTIPREVLPSLALAVETEELGIAAGLQDRVIQVFGGLVYMDFAREQMQESCGYRHGVYEPLDPALLPPLYIAYKNEVSEPTEVFHNAVRARFDNGDRAVVAAMQKFAALAAQARAALLSGDTPTLNCLINENFDTRRTLFQLPAGQVELVDMARRLGASAKFAGSGGAVIGVYADAEMFERLKRAYAAAGCTLIKPIIDSA